MELVSELTIEGKTVFRIDYSGANEQQMISLLKELQKQLEAKNKPVLILSIYNDKNFATPHFMRAVEEVTAAVLPLIDGQAIVGLSFTKKLILKGYNLMFNKNYLDFDTEEEAIAFLLHTPTAKKR
jgi:hypothetical protein